MQTREEIFDRDFNGSLVNDRSISTYRAKLIKSGPILEAQFYPVWATGADRRRARSASTPRAMQELNRRNSQKEFNRRVYANFVPGDLWLSLTYADPEPGLAQVKTDLRNYIKRLKRWREKHCCCELKYLYFIHGGTGGKRVHIHMFVNAMDRDTAEALWSKGRANTKRLQADPSDYLAPISNYTSRKAKPDEEYTRRWGGSQNLVKPTVKYPRHKLSRRKSSKIAEDFQQAKTIIEQEFKGYRLLELEIKQSEFVSGAYMYATLRRRE